MEDDIMTVEEVAAKLDLHIETVRLWLRNGRLRGVRVPGTRRWYVRKADFDALFEKAGQGQPGARG